MPSKVGFQSLCFSMILLNSDTFLQFWSLTYSHYCITTFNVWLFFNSYPLSSVLVSFFFINLTRRFLSPSLASSKSHLILLILTIYCCFLYHDYLLLSLLLPSFYFLSIYFEALFQFSPLLLISDLLTEAIFLIFNIYPLEVSLMKACW